MISVLRNLVVYKIISIKSKQRNVRPRNERGLFIQEKTMNVSTQSETNAYHTLRAEQLQAVYVSLLGGVALSGENDHPDIETIWSELGDQATIQQGTIHGVFGPNDVLIELGSNPGGHITISAKTADGIEEIRLDTHNGKPNFAITAQLSTKLSSSQTNYAIPNVQSEGKTLLQND